MIEREYRYVHQMYAESNVLYHILLVLARCTKCINVDQEHTHALLLACCLLNSRLWYINIIVWMHSRSICILSICLRVGRRTSPCPLWWRNRWVWKWSTPTERRWCGWRWSLSPCTCPLRFVGATLPITEWESTEFGSEAVSTELGQIMRVIACVQILKETACMGYYTPWKFL